MHFFVKDCIRAPPKWGYRGKSQGSREISRAEGLGFPLQGVDQEILPCGREGLTVFKSILPCWWWQIEQWTCKELQKKEQIIDALYFCEDLEVEGFSYLHCKFTVSTINTFLHHIQSNPIPFYLYVALWCYINLRWFFYPQREELIWFYNHCAIGIKSWLTHFVTYF